MGLDELTSCAFCGGGCTDPSCWECYSPFRPENLRTLAKNLSEAAMLCAAWQLREDSPAWAPGCGVRPTGLSPYMAAAIATQRRRPHD